MRSALVTLLVSLVACTSITKADATYTADATEAKDTPSLNSDTEGETKACINNDEYQKNGACLPLPLVEQGTCPAKFGFWKKTFPAVRDYSLTKEQLEQLSGVYKHSTEKEKYPELFPEPTSGKKEINYRILRIPVSQIYPMDMLDFPNSATQTMTAYGFVAADAADLLTFAGKYHNGGNNILLPNTPNDVYAMIALDRAHYDIAGNLQVISVTTEPGPNINKTYWLGGFYNYDVYEDGNGAGFCLMFLVKPKE